MRSLNQSYKMLFAIDGFTGKCTMAQRWTEEFETRFKCLDSSGSKIHVDPSITDFDSITDEEVLFFGRKVVY